MQQDNTTPRIILRRHARDRAAECCIPPQILRQRIRSISPHLAAFAGVLDGKGKVALMFRDGVAPVIRHAGDTIEVVSVLRPGQRAICRDTLEVRVGSRPNCLPTAQARHLSCQTQSDDGRRRHRAATAAHIGKRPRLDREVAR
jgi:hypothetical protein